MCSLVILGAHEVVCDVVSGLLGLWCWLLAQLWEIPLGRWECHRSFRCWLPPCASLRLVLCSPFFFFFFFFSFGLFRVRAYLPLNFLYPSTPLHSLQVYSSCSLDVDESSGGTSGNKSGKGKGNANANVRQSSSSSSSPSSSSDGMLFSLKVKLELPPAPSHGRDKNQAPKCPFWGNELVALSSPRWNSPGSGSGSGSAAVLGVVQSWDPVYDKQSKRPFDKCAVLIRVLVCAGPAGGGGGDGAGGRGGWLSLEHARECLGRGKSSAGVPVKLSSGGASLMTACREFQAVMSVAGLPETVRRCLLDPSVSKESKRAAAAAVPAPREISGSSDGRALAAVSNGRGVGQAQRGGGARGGKGGGGDGGADDAAGAAEGSGSVPPSNVPAKLWRSLLQAFNRSQVQAIRRVVEGSPSGFTLLQVRGWGGGLLLYRRAGHAVSCRPWCWDCCCRPAFAGSRINHATCTPCDTRLCLGCSYI